VFEARACKDGDDEEGDKGLARQVPAALRDPHRRRHEPVAQHPAHEGLDGGWCCGVSSTLHCQVYCIVLHWSKREHRFIHFKHSFIIITTTTTTTPRPLLFYNINVPEHTAPSVPSAAWTHHAEGQRALAGGEADDGGHRVLEDARVGAEGGQERGPEEVSQPRQGPVLQELPAGDLWGCGRG
jgi:hypothetical protein